MTTGPTFSEAPTEPGGLPAYKVVMAREEQPSAKSPLTYREVVYTVAPGTAEEDAEMLLRKLWADMAQQLWAAPPGKFLNLAVFDVAFTGRPPKPPLVTLTWKDWRGPTPDIAFPLRQRASQRPPSIGTVPPPVIPANAPVPSIAAASPSMPPVSSGPPTQIPPTVPSSSGRVLAAEAPRAPTPAEVAPVAPSVVAPPPAAPSVEVDLSVEVDPTPAPTPAMEVPSRETSPPADTEQAPTTPSATQEPPASPSAQAASPPAAPAPSPELPRSPDERAREQLEASSKPAESPPGQLRSTEEPGPSTRETTPQESRPPVAEGKPAAAEPPVEAVKPTPEESSPPVEAAKPPVEEPIPSVTEAKPAAEEAKPAVEEAKPAVEEAKPAAEEAKPAVEEAKPPVEEAKPPVEEAKPPVEEAKPTAEEAKPPVEEPIPSVAEAKPAVEETKPAAEEAKPPVEGVKSTPEEPTPPIEEEKPAAEEAKPSESESMGGMVKADPFAAPTPPKEEGPPKDARGKVVKRKSRLAGDDLLGDLFEAMHDVHFQPGVLEGAHYVLWLAVEKMPCKVAVCHLFDINRREFVVTHVLGECRKDLLLRRAPEKEPLIHQTMRRRRALVLEGSDALLSGERWKHIGQPVASVVVAPVVLGGRFLGLLELINPVDREPFVESDGYALAYIGEQFAEFLGQRGLMLDPEAIANFRPPKL